MSSLSSPNRRLIMVVYVVMVEKKNCGTFIGGVYDSYRAAVNCAIGWNNESNILDASVHKQHVWAEVEEPVCV